MLVKKIFKQVSEVVNNFSEDEIFTRSAALAFYTMLSFAPLAVLTVVLLATLDLNLQQQLVFQIESLVGHQAADLFQIILNSAKSRPDLTTLSGWLGFGALLFSASLIFVQIQTTLNLVFEVESENENASDDSLMAQAKRLVIDRLVSIGVLLAIIFVAIVSLIVSTGIYFLLGNSQVWWSQLFNEGFSLLVFTILFSLIFKWMPDRAIRWSNAVLGGFITALLFVIGKFGIGMYMGQSALGSSYGAAGSLAIVLAWVYYSSLVMFLGAEVSYVALLESKEPDPEKAKKPSVKPKQSGFAVAGR